MKKRIQKSIAILGAAVLTMGLAGCSSSSNTPASSAPAADTAEAPAADVQAESAADTQAAEAAAGLSGSAGRFHFHRKICKCPGRGIYGEIS